MVLVMMGGGSGNMLVIVVGVGVLMVRVSSCRHEGSSNDTFEYLFIQCICSNVFHLKR